MTWRLLAAAFVVALLTGVLNVATGTPPGRHHHPLSPDIRPTAADMTLSRTGWTVTADSQQGSYPASNVIDGNTATFWHTQYSPTAPPLPHTVTIDLHATATVTGLRYLPRTDHANGRIGTFQLHTSTDGASWTTAATGTFPDDASEKSLPFAATTARYIRLTALTEAGNRGPWTTAAEINLTGTPAPTLPRAGWTVTADSQAGSYPASNVLDGNPATFWHTPYAPTTPLPHTLTIDTHATTAITGLRYLPRQDHPNGRIGGYQVHTSPDGTTWTTVATGTFPDDATEKILPLTAVTTRYIRLTALTEAGNRGPWTTAAEINLTGTPVPTLPRAGWTVTADSQAGSYPASNVIDGITTTIWHTSYSGTPPPLPHALTIDLHTTTTVTGLRYLPRQDHPNGRIGGYQIHASTDGTTWGNPIATGTFPDSATEKSVAFAAVTTRYLRLTALTEAGNRGPWTTAAEINLTGSLPAPTARTGGTWGPTIGFPLVPVAAAQLAGGTLLTWSAQDPYDYKNGGGKTQTATVNLATGTVSQRTVSETGHDMFCPGTARLTDGRLFVNGGSDSEKTSIYDPTTSTWSAGANMIIPRGYQSAVTLSDGRVFTLGGSWGGGVGGKDGEVWSADTGWRRLPGVPVAPILTGDPRGEYRADNHPWFFAVPGGRVFHAGPSRQLNWFDANGDGGFTPAGTRADDQDAMNGFAAMYDVGKILTTGGATAYENADASNRAYVIDIGGGTAAVHRVDDLAYPRAFHNGVVLPDGKVIIVGGQSYAKPFSDMGSVLNAELWDPATEHFTTLAAMSVPRNYHSVAMLLPDGRVFAGGGGLCGACATNHLDGQIFTPPYLYAPDGSLASRPAITSAPATAALGTAVTVATDRAVSGFSLVRMGSVTHSINTDQRRVPLTPIAADGNSYTLQLPADPGVVVPGDYMLFALDAAGVPSMAVTMRIS